MFKGGRRFPTGFQMRRMLCGIQDYSTFMGVASHYIFLLTDVPLPYVKSLDL